MHFAFTICRNEKGFHWTVLEQVEQNRLGFKFIVEAGHHSYREFGIQKINLSGLLRSFSIINNLFPGMKRVSITVLEQVE
jgi:hypothetical protein